MLRELSLFNARFPIQEIRYDKSYMDGIKLEMSKAGIVLPIVEFRQGYISMGRRCNTSPTNCAPAKFAMVATRS